MLRFLYGVLSERSSDSTTGQGERASVEPPIAVVHLKNMVELGNKTLKGTTNVLSCLFRLTLGEEQLRNPNSVRVLPCYARDKPKSCRIPSVDTFPSRRTVLRINFENNPVTLTNLPLPPLHFPQGHGRLPRSAQQLSEPRPGLIDPIFGELFLSHFPPVTFS